jgi:hypothetical protein
LVLGEKIDKRAYRENKKLSSRLQPFEKIFMPERV